MVDDLSFLMWGTVGIFAFNIAVMTLIVVMTKPQLSYSLEAKAAPQPALTTDGLE